MFGAHTASYSASLTMAAGVYIPKELLKWISHCISPKNCMKAHRFCFEREEDHQVNRYLFQTLNFKNNFHHYAAATFDASLQHGV